MIARDRRPILRPVSPAKAEQQIRHTRAELALTLDALERKLTARHLVEKGFDMFNTLNGNESLHRGLDMIRANPVPVALIGIGVAWLIANNTGVVDRIAHDERIEAARRRVVDTASDMSRRAGELATGVAETVGLGGAASTSSDRALGHTGHPMVDRNGREHGEGWIHQASDKAQDALRSARDSGGAILNRVGGYANTGQVGDAFERNPLIMGAIGIIAGALIAALVPLSRMENELLGETRDDLWHKAEEAGEQAVQRVRDTASEAAIRAVDAATGVASEAIESVRHVEDKPSRS